MIKQAEETLFSKIPADIHIISDIFSKAGHKLFLVGGSVRDAIRGRDPEDFDLATDAIPEQTIELLKEFKCKLHGEAFAVVVVHTDEHPEGFEIASFRTDLSDADGKQGRHPEVKTGVTIEEDVMRRDFTCNALFFDIKTKTIIDMVGGIKDIMQGQLKCVGDPIERFKEDQLRTLRAIRFAARFDFKIETITARAIIDFADLSEISRERIVLELTKAFKQCKSMKSIFDLLKSTEMLEKCFILKGHKGIDELEIQLSDTFGLDTKPKLGPPAFLSRIFRDTKDLKHLEILLHQACWPTDDIKGCITLLKWGRTLSVETAFELFRDLPKIRWDTKTSILKLAHFLQHFIILEKDIQLLGVMLIMFQPTIDADQLMEQGFKGKELGAEILRLETEAIKALLQEDSWLTPIS